MRQKYYGFCALLGEGPNEITRTKREKRMKQGVFSSLGIVGLVLCGAKAQMPCTMFFRVNVLVTQNLGFTVCKRRRSFSRLLRSLFIILKHELLITPSTLSCQNAALSRSFILSQWPTAVFLNGMNHYFFALGFFTVCSFVCFLHARFDLWL